MTTEQTKSGPLVSILICNYNYGRFIATAIESALSQTYSNIEVIVVDDGSTDNSREVIERYSGRVRAIFQQNGGQSAAFNAGFAASSGEIICLLDSDDYFFANKVAKVLEGYARNPSAKWLFHPVQRIHDNGAGTEVREPLEAVGQSRILDYRHRPNTFTAPPTSGLSFRRPTFDRITPIPDRLISPDNYMKFVILALYPGFYLTEALGVLRLHGSNAYSMGVSDETRAESVIENAAAMRTRFPELTPKADRLISIMQANLWKGLGAGVIVRNGLRNYLQESSTGSKIRIYAVAAFRYTKHSIQSMVKGRYGTGGANKLQANPF
jgi:glycosyltransferase involved in cell wall biosynthesis